MKDGLKSLLIEEHIHHVAKKYCAINKTTIKAWVERLILEATEPVKQPSKKKK